MRAIRKRPGEAPEIVDIENTLEALQAEVGGKLKASALRQTPRSCAMKKEN